MQALYLKFYNILSFINDCFFIFISYLIIKISANYTGIWVSKAMSLKLNNTFTYKNNRDYSFTLIAPQALRKPFSYFIR